MDKRRVVMKALTGAADGATKGVAFAVLTSLATTSQSAVSAAALVGGMGTLAVGGPVLAGAALVGAVLGGVASLVRCDRGGESGGKS